MPIGLTFFELQDLVEKKMKEIALGEEEVKFQEIMKNYDKDFPLEKREKLLKTAKQKLKNPKLPKERKEMYEKSIKILINPHIDARELSKK